MTALLVVLLVPPALPEEWSSRIDEIYAAVRAGGSDADYRELMLLGQMRGASSRRAAWALMVGAEGLASRLARRADLWEQRAHFLAQARVGARGYGDEARATRCAVQLGDLLSARGRLASAREVTERALEECPGDDPYRAHLHYRLAELAGFRNAWDEGLAHLDDAEASVRPDLERVQRVLLPMLVALRGSLLLSMGLPDLAAPYVMDARGRVEALVAKGERAFGARALLSVTLARLRLVTGRFETLVEEVDRALEQEDLIGARPSLVPELRLRQAIACLHLELEDPSRPARAEKLLDLVSNDTRARRGDRLAAALRRARLRLATGRAADARAELAEAGELLAAWREVQDRELPAIHFAYHAALRVRLASQEGVRDRAQLQELRNALEMAVRRLIAEWDAGSRRPGGVGFLASRSVRFVLSELADVDVALGGTEDGAEAFLVTLWRAREVGTLLRRLREREPGLYPRARDPAEALEALRRELPADQGVLIYLPAADRSHLFLVDREHVAHVPLEREEGIFDAATRFAREVGQSPRGVDPAERQRILDQEGVELRDLLLPAEARRRIARWREIVIIGRDVLGPVPFEALPMEASTWGRRTVLCSVPSLPVLGFLRARARSLAEARRRGVVVLATAPSREAFPLAAEVAPFEVEEEQRRALVAAFPDARVLEGPGATLASVLRSCEESVFSLTVVAHGVEDLGRERSHGLAMSGGPGGAGILWCVNAEALTLPPLTVLCSCSASAGPARLGDGGISHLGGACLIGGSVGVVLPTGPVVVQPSLALAAAFHEGLEAGPGEALRRARDVIAADPRWADPYYYGRFQLMGLPDLPRHPGLRNVARETPNTSASLWWWLGGLVAAGGVLIIAFWQRRNGAGLQHSRRASGQIRN